MKKIQKSRDEIKNMPLPFLLTYFISSDSAGLRITFSGKPFLLFFFSPL